jgi:hypothetical protein
VFPAGFARKGVFDSYVRQVKSDRFDNRKVTHLGLREEVIVEKCELTPKSWTLFRRFLVQTRGPEHAPPATAPRIRLG